MAKEILNKAIPDLVVHFGSRGLVFSHQFDENFPLLPGLEAVIANNSLHVRFNHLVQEPVYNLLDPKKFKSIISNLRKLWKEELRLCKIKADVWAGASAHLRDLWRNNGH